MDQRIERARQIVECEAVAVRQVAGGLGEPFLRALDMILGLSGRVVTTGMEEATEDLADLLGAMPGPSEEQQDFAWFTARLARAWASGPMTPRSFHARPTCAVLWNVMARTRSPFSCMGRD